MSINTMKLCKRNVFERKALRLVRSAEWEGDAALPFFGNGEGDEFCQAHFGHLRASAVRNGLMILPLDSPYLTSSELLMLRWLAEAQRQNGLRTCHLEDIDLKTSLGRCAILLKMLGTCLPANTLHIHTDLDAKLKAVNSRRQRAAGHGIRRAPFEEWTATQRGFGRR